MSEEKNLSTETDAGIEPEATGTCYTYRDCTGTVIGQNVTKRYCFDSLSGRGWKGSDGKCVDYLD